MFAKTFFTVKPELIGRVLAVHPGLQRVGVAAGAQARHGSIDQGGGIVARQGRVGAHLRCQGQGARIEAWRQGRELTQLSHGCRGAVAEFRVAFSPVAHHIGDRACGHPLQILRHVGGVAGQFWGFWGGFQHHQPGALVRLQRHFIAQRRAFHLQVGWHGGTGRPTAVLTEWLGFPFAAIKG